MYCSALPPTLTPFPTRRSSDLISLATQKQVHGAENAATAVQSIAGVATQTEQGVLQSRRTVDELAQLAEELTAKLSRSEEHTSELQSLRHLVCRLLLEKKKETD